MDPNPNPHGFALMFGSGLGIESRGNIKANLKKNITLPTIFIIFVFLKTKSNYLTSQKLHTLLM